MKINQKRIYEQFSEVDGYRVLVDRLWPRGVKKESAHIDLWAKAITPSNELRKWFHQNTNEYSKFEEAYLKELNNNPECPTFIRQISDYEVITLLTAAKNIDHSHVPILKQFIKTKI